MGGSPTKPWDGMDWRETPPQDWVDGLSDQEYDEWQDWRARSEREQDARDIEDMLAPPSAEKAAEDERLAQEQIRRAWGEVAQATQPQLRIVDAAGNPLDRVVDDQPVKVRVEVPHAHGETPPETIEITFTTVDGKTDTMTARLNADVRDVATYISEPITTKNGGGGTGSIGGFEFTARWELGGLSGFDLRDGDGVTISAGGATSSIRVFTSGARLVTDAASQAIGNYVTLLTNVLVNLRGVERDLVQYPDSPEKTEFQNFINAIRTDTEIRLGIASRARTMLNSELSDIPKAAAANVYISILGLNRKEGQDVWTIPDSGGGLVEMNQLQTSYDQRVERDMVFNAQEQSKGQIEGHLWHGMAQATIGGYRLLVNATGAAQLKTAFGGWLSAAVGRDGRFENEMGEGVSRLDRFMAFTDLLAQGALMGAMTKFNLDTILPTRGSLGGITHTQPRIDRPGGAKPTTPDGVGKPMVGAQAGQVVRDSADIGMTGEMGRRFNAILDQKAGEWGRGIRALQRPAGRAAVEQHASGAAGKPEPIKAKGVNEADIEGGWAPVGTDRAAYYTPEQLTRATGQPIERFADPSAPQGITQKVWDRARQRLKEYHDEKPMMDEITSRGLAEVGADGVIIDRGISNYRLDPDTHELVDGGWGGPVRGTGRPMASDPDPYEYLWQDPATGKWERIPPAQEAELTNALHDAGVMHGPIAHWNPTEPKNINIKNTILGGHDAVSVRDGQIVINPNAEALVQFGGRAVPRVVTYGDVGVQTGGGGLTTGAQAVTGIDALPIPGFQPFGLWGASTQELLDGSAPSGEGWTWTQQYDWTTEIPQWNADLGATGADFGLNEVFDPISQTWVPLPPSATGGALHLQTPRGRAWLKPAAAAAAVLVIGGIAATLFGGGKTAEPANATGAASVDLGALAPVAPVLRDAGVSDPLIGAAAPGAFTDGTGDFIYSSTKHEPGDPNPDIDILTSTAFAISGDHAITGALNGSAFGCGTAAAARRTVCAQEAPAFPSGDVVIISSTFGAPLPGTQGATQYEYSVVFDDDGQMADNWRFVPPYDWDLYQGTDHWYTVYRDDKGAFAVGSARLENGQPAITPTSARAVIDGATMTWFIPSGEFRIPMPRWRTASFRHDGSFHPDRSAADVSGVNPTEPLRALPAATVDSPKTDSSAQPAPAPETPANFVDVFNSAHDQRDVGTLFQRLHPAVIERYGEDQCMTYLQRTAGTVRDLTSQKVEGPSTVTYESDGKRARFAGGFELWGNVQVNGSARPIYMRLVPIDGEIRWFTDCGTPR